MRIAVIGTGISGSLAARLLATQHQVVVYEANDYPGGHANTVDITVWGQNYSVDTGFMVFNRRTYPNFCRLLQLLQIPSRPSDMSFGVRCGQSGLEYQGSSLNGLFAQRANCLRPSFLRMLRDIITFNRRGTSAAEDDLLDDGVTVGQFLESCHVSHQFVENYLAPMAAAIWSSNPSQILDFPAKFLVGFFANHGLMQLRNRPQWYTIPGGSRRYVTALLDPIWKSLRLRCPVTEVTRSDIGVQIATMDGRIEDFDHVVFASHADQTLRILSDATTTETEILQCFPYQKNEAVLHTDTQILPRRRRAWASWNYHTTPTADQSAIVTYDLNRLQGLNARRPILLTLNSQQQQIETTKVLRTFTYHHPIFSRASIVAQDRRNAISGHRRTHFCGAYWGYGFHEDGVNSALAVAQDFGIELEACTVASTKDWSPMPALAQ